MVMTGLRLATYSEGTTLSPAWNLVVAPSTTDQPSQDYSDSGKAGLQEIKGWNMQNMTKIYLCDMSISNKTHSCHCLIQHLPQFKACFIARLKLTYTHSVQDITGQARKTLYTQRLWMAKDGQHGGGNQNSLVL